MVFYRHALVRGWAERQAAGGATVSPLTHGIIQGRLLAPILFLISTNDLACHLDSKIAMYADDVQFLHLGPPEEMTALEAQVQGI